MEHPLLYLNLLFSKLGLPIVHSPEQAHTFLEHLLLPHVTYTWVVMLILIVGAKLLVRKVQLIPEAGGQNFMEVVISGIEEFMVDITGEEGRYYFPIIGTLAFFILFSNYMGMIPGFYGPTSNINTTLGCALIAVLYTHVIGVKFHGAKYIKHFLGPIWWLSPLIFPIELIGHGARVISLSIRLFGNIFGEELVLAILFFLAGLYLAPLPIMFLGLFTGLVQAFIFVLLTMMYFAGAIEEAH